MKSWTCSDGSMHWLAIFRAFLRHSITRFPSRICRCNISRQKVTAAVETYVYHVWTALNLLTLYSQHNYCPSLMWRSCRYEHMKNQSNAPLHRFCQCCDQTRRDGRRYWLLGTGLAFSAAWRQPAHTGSSVARGFPHWSIAFAQRSRWSAWWQPTGLWSRWSHPRTERKPGEGNGWSEKQKHWRWGWLAVRIPNG